jgi:hypothetical protein
MIPTEQEITLCLLNASKAISQMDRNDLRTALEMILKAIELQNKLINKQSIKHES